MATRRADKQILDELDDIVNRVLPTADPKPSRTSLIKIDNLEATDDDSDSGSDAGGATGSGTPGSGEPLFDMSVFGFTSSAEVLLAELIRQGESKFGWVPDTKDPSKRQEAGARNRGPQRHPLLSESQRFDGADPKLNALPTDNPEARDEFNRLANELRPTARPTNTLIQTSTPTFKPI